MKAIRYLAIALGIVVILASITWILRNSIIQRLSGPILSEYGMSIGDVSLDALATENAEISYLELEHSNGTTILIDDLTLPITTSSSGTKTFAAEKVTIDVPTTRDSEPLALARLIEQLLSLPQTLASTEIRVAQLSISPYPIANNLSWISTERGQILRSSVGTIDLSIEIVATEESKHAVEVSIRDAYGNVPEQSITAGIQQIDSGITLNGMSILDLAAWTSIIEVLTASAGMAELVFEGHVPFDVSSTATFNVGITPSTPLQLSLSITPDEVASVSVRSASSLKLSATYPENQWSLSGENASVLMSYAQWNDMSVLISDFECSNGPTCFMNMQLAMDNADLTFATTSRLELSAAQDIVFGDDGMQMLIRPGAELSLAGLDVSGTEMAALNALLTSAAKLDLADSGWQLSADSVDASVESLSLDDDMTFSAPFSLQTLSVGDLDRALSMKVAVDSASSQLSWDSQEIALPGFNGTVFMQGEEMVTELTTIGLYEEAAIQAQHDLSTDTGRISIKNGALSFDVQKLSNRVSPWTNDLDVSAGTISFDLEFNWEMSDSGWQLVGQTILQMENLAGTYGDTAFAGLTTGLNSAYQTATGFSVEPGSIDIALVEVGLPVENISADYTLHPNALSADVENLKMHAFGGVIQADPFSYEMESERNTLFVRAESIQLTELLTLKEFEAIELSGSIAAELPVIIEGDEISILDGKLIGEAPGGVIRYRPGIVSDDDGTSAIDIVTEALSNFEYDTLSSTVGYSKGGDLVLQMRIAGRNPDLADNRPVVLNLGVENNIPKMLKSLQAARAVEEILEKRLVK